MVEKRIVITGGTGMVGSSFPNVSGHELIRLGSRDCDFRDLEKTKKIINDLKPQYLIHLAARVGGVKSNMDFKGEYYFDNVSINTNVLEACHLTNVEKVVSLLSTCVYPDSADYPLAETSIHNGRPHFSNYPYAYAKRMLDVQSRAYREQYGCNFITAVPNNIYGPYDNFSLDNSHVIPAIIRKVWEAKKNDSQLTLWGDGSPLREFTFSQDVGEALWFLVKNYNEPGPINIGNTCEFSIKEIASIISRHLHYNGEIFWDSTKPSGQYRKPSSNQRFIDLGWDNNSYTTFEDGIKLTCNWFIENYPQVRGI